MEPKITKLADHLDQHGETVKVGDVVIPRDKRERLSAFHTWVVTRLENLTYEPPDDWTSLHRRIMVHVALVKAVVVDGECLTGSTERRFDLEEFVEAFEPLTFGLPTQKYNVHRT